jgi:hypothetical protein
MFYLPTKGKSKKRRIIFYNPNVTKINSILAISTTKLLTNGYETDEAIQVEDEVQVEYEEEEYDEQNSL